MAPLDAQTEIGYAGKIVGRPLRSESVCGFIESG
jgi:hypothetical protein